MFDLISEKSNIILTSNSSRVSTWVCSAGMAFSSLSGVIVLITPSALREQTNQSHA